MKQTKITLNLAGNPKEYDVTYTVDKGVVTLKEIKKGEENTGFYSVHKARLIYKKICKLEGIRHREGI